MKSVNAILTASGLVLALSLSGWAQEVKQLPTQTVTLSGTVATIDHEKRTVNIKKADGSFETVDVPQVRSGSMSSRLGTRCRSRITTTSQRD